MKIIKLYFSMLIVSNAPLAHAHEYFAGNYFSFAGCNTPVGEDLVYLQKINIDEPSTVRLTSFGMLLTAVAGDFERGSTRFGLYSNQGYRGTDYPHELLAETYDQHYYPYTVPQEPYVTYRIEANPIQSIDLDPGVYWIALTSKIRGAGMANTGCRAANGKSSMVLTSHVTSPFFPEMFSEPFASLSKVEDDKNFYILYETQSATEE